MKPAKNTIRWLAIFLCLALVGLAEGEEYLSNLGNRWPDPTGTSMGDFEVLVYGYDPFEVHFFTGSGLNERRYAKMRTGVPGSPLTNSPTVEHFALNSVTFEFIGGISQPWPWSDITIELHQQGGANSVPLGEFGKPSFNPTQTQWPDYTSFIDFHPLTNILLKPSSEYFVSLSVPFGYSLRPLPHLTCQCRGLQLQRGMIVAMDYFADSTATSQELG